MQGSNFPRKLRNFWVRRIENRRVISRWQGPCHSLYRFSRDNTCYAGDLKARTQAQHCTQCWYNIDRYCTRDKKFEQVQFLVSSSAVSHQKIPHRVHNGTLNIIFTSYKFGVNLFAITQIIIWTVVSSKFPVGLFPWWRGTFRHSSFPRLATPLTSIYKDSETQLTARGRKETRRPCALQDDVIKNLKKISS